MISITNLSKKFTDLNLFSGLNLSVNREEIIAIIGPRGCGKTTILRTRSVKKETTAQQDSRTPKEAQQHEQTINTTNETKTLTHNKTQEHYLLRAIPTRPKT